MLTCRTRLRVCHASGVSSTPVRPGVRTRCSNARTRCCARTVRSGRWCNCRWSVNTVAATAGSTTPWVLGRRCLASTGVSGGVGSSQGSMTGTGAYSSMCCRIALATLDGNGTSLTSRPWGSPSASPCRSPRPARRSRGGAGSGRAVPPAPPAPARAATPRPCRVWPPEDRPCWTDMDCVPGDGSRWRPEDDIGAGGRPGLDSAQPTRDPRHDLIAHRPTAGRAYAMVRGHRTVFRSPHDPR